MEIGRADLAFLTGAIPTATAFASTADQHKSMPSSESVTQAHISEYRRIREMKMKRQMRGEGISIPSSSPSTMAPKGNGITKPVTIPQKAAPIKVYMVDPKTGQKVPVNFGSPVSPARSVSPKTMLTPPTTSTSPPQPERKRTRSGGRSFTLDLDTIAEE
eukprot:Nk52_evm31s2474 gene=Nk52_evmTU31s2474